MVHRACLFGRRTGGKQCGGAPVGGIAYGKGPLNVRFGYNNRNNDVTAAAGAAMTPPVAAASRDNGHNAVLAANYDFGLVKVYGAYGRDRGPNSAPLPNSSNPYGGVRPTASTDGAEGLIGVSVPAGDGVILVSYIRKDDHTVFNQDASQLGVAYSYPMSKRTNVYVAYARIRNQHGAGYTVGNNGEAGSGDAAFNLGVRHSF